MAAFVPLISNKPLDGHPYALNGLYSQMLYIQLLELALTKLKNVTLNKMFNTKFCRGLSLSLVTRFSSFGMQIVG